jgi:hypothetical protein
MAKVNATPAIIVSVENERSASGGGETSSSMGTTSAKAKLTETKLIEADRS